jgi:hypothetical protein
VPDLQIGTAALHELKGSMRSDRSHSNYNGAQVTGAEKHERDKDPDGVEIQKQQAVDLDEKISGVAAPAVGPWQRQLNELGGVKQAAGLRSVRGTRARI